ncbi:hypothetical protein AB0B54_25680 [Microbispora bryophytorum]
MYHVAERPAWSQPIVYARTACSTSSPGRGVRVPEDAAAGALA